MKPTSSLVFLDSTRSQSPIMLRTAAKYAKPTRIQNHTRGLYQFMYSILLFPPESAGEPSLSLRGKRTWKRYFARGILHLPHSLRCPRWSAWSQQSRWPPGRSSPQCVWRWKQGWWQRQCSRPGWRGRWTWLWFWSGWSACVFADSSIENKLQQHNKTVASSRVQCCWITD